MQVNQNNNPVSKIAYTIDEVVSATGIGRTSIYELLKDGSLKSFKAAGRRLIRKTDLEAYLEGCFQETSLK